MSNPMPTEPTTPSGEALDTLVQFCRRCGKWNAVASIDSMMARTLRQSRLMSDAEWQTLARAGGCRCREERAARRMGGRGDAD